MSGRTDKFRASKLSTFDMSFVRRSSSFAAVKKPDESQSKFIRSDSFVDHDFFYDVEDMHVLKAGGLPKVYPSFKLFLPPLLNDPAPFAMQNSCTQVVAVFT